MTLLFSYQLLKITMLSIDELRLILGYTNNHNGYLCLKMKTKCSLGAIQPDQFHRNVSVER